MTAGGGASERQQQEALATLRLLFHVPSGGRSQCP